MDLFIILIVAVSAIHFIWEGIVAPSYRARLRNEMFCLRDELREIKIDERHDCSHDAFEIVHGGINQYLNRLSDIDGRFVYRVNHAMRKAPLSDEVMRRKQVLEECKSKELHSIIKKSGDVLEKAFFTNVGAWILLLAPLLVVLTLVLLMVLGWSHLTQRIAQRFLRLFALPQSKVEKFIPEHLSPISSSSFL